MPSIGDRLAGRYRLDAVIGSGGFATVFRAHDVLLERDVAVKCLLAGEATDPVVAARFDREARVLAAVSHPNVVTIHDVAPGGPGPGDAPFFVMDLCEGGSLADRLTASASGSLPPDELTPILEDAAAGVAALHAIGIIHRDLKPSNILLADGRGRIADLGIAVAGPSELTAVGTTVGTLDYLAPEQLAGVPASPASDVHALGIVAFLGLTGELPRPAGSVTDAVAASRLPARLVSALRPGLGTAFDVAISGALASDPLRRPTAAELGTTLGFALERWRDSPRPVTPPQPVRSLPMAADETTLVDVAVPRQSAPPSGPAPAQRRNPVPLMVVGGLLAALLLGSGAYLALGLGGPGGGDLPSMAVDAGSSEPVTAMPTTVPSSRSAATATATQAPTAADEAYVAARAASAEMRAAIDGARGAGGLNGRDPKELDSRLARFDRALDKGDPKAARDEAGKVANQVAKLIRDGSVDAQAGAGLQKAANGLVAAASALPD